MDAGKQKPRVFVLMPFSEAFNDVYKFGIKAACKDVGATCERVDEQIFGELILGRIYSQIANADLIVADMTGRNENVFYEVGFAHARGKIVILLTRDLEDIPFDLKHYPHIPYKGSIEKLRADLRVRLRWFLNHPEDPSGRVIAPLPKFKFHRATSSDRKNIYEQVYGPISRASESIIAVSYHVQGPDPAGEPINKYYDFIEEVLEKRRSSFEYTRIYQLAQPDKKITSKAIGQRAYLHLKTMLSKKIDNSLSNVRIHLYRTPVQVQATLLLIDGTELFVGIPQVTSKGVIMSTLMQFCDSKGEDISLYTSMINDVKDASVPINTTSDGRH